MEVLLKWWESTTSTFHLLIGEMMNTVEYIHWLYYIPIHDQRIYHVVDRDDILSVIAYFYGDDQVDTIMYDIILGRINYI